jgi:hypothetical protein
MQSYQIRLRRRMLNYKVWLRSGIDAATNKNPAGRTKPGKAAAKLRSAPGADNACPPGRPGSALASAVGRCDGAEGVRGVQPGYCRRMAVGAISDGSIP